MARLREYPRKGWEYTKRGYGHAKTGLSYGTGYRWLGSSERHGSYGLMIFLGLAVHLIQITRYFFGTLNRDVFYYAMHFALAIIFLWFIDWRDKGIWSVFVAYMIWPTIVFYLMKGDVLYSLGTAVLYRSFISLYVSTFMWPFWLLYGCYMSESKGAKTFLTIFQVVFIIALVPAMVQLPSFSNAAGVLGEKTGVEVRQIDIIGGLIEMGGEIKEFITTTPGKLSEGWERQKEYATGGYYKGKVEENVREPLGVYLEKIMKAETEFYEDEDVILWGTIKARTLDEDNPIYVGLSCYANKDSKEERKGTITPSNLRENFKIETFDEEDFSCEFGRGKLKKGTNNIKFLAEFNFPTMAYLKTYFMDQDRRRAMIREGIDILNEYGITDKNPIATFTNGPVKIGAETTKSLPVGVYEDRTVRLGVTLENQWRGKIKNITELVIEVPESMRIANCEGIVLGKGKGTKTGDGFKRYNINLPKRRFENIKTFKSFNCNLVVDEKDKLLGTTPIATRYYRIMVKYDYELESSMSVNVKKVPGEEKEVEVDGIPTVTGKWFRVKATWFSFKKPDGTWKDKPGAYGDRYEDNVLFASLPAGGLRGKKINIKSKWNTIRNVPIVDKGPWFIDDDYWNKDGIPFAKKNEGKYRYSQSIKGGVSDTATNYDSKPINGAGIDLSRGLLDALGTTGGEVEVEWQFAGKIISAFDVWPVDEPHIITSKYGWRDLDNNPSTGDNGKEDLHDGIDLRASVGTNVKSVAEGIVYKTCEGYCGGYGYNIIIKHNENLYTRYSHLSHIHVKDGNVNADQVIALSGNTGHSTGPHLDFKVYTSKDFEKEKDKGVDPTKYLQSLP